MNYNKPELINALSAQYVLGTLRGKARDRFDSIKFANEDIQQSVNYWEAQLHPMSYTLKPVKPSDHVWQNIQAKLEAQGDIQALENEPKAQSNVVSVERKAPANDSTRKWKWVSGLAMAACLVLAILLVPYKTSQLDRLQSVAVISNEVNKTLWSFDIMEKTIVVKTTTFVPKLPDNDYQLWIVPASGDAPISIGVMAQTREFVLDKPEIFDKISIAALAVSKEPKGGSPNGAPTTVLYTSEIAQL